MSCSQCLALVDEHGLGSRYLKQLHSIPLLAAALFSFGSQAIKNWGFLEKNRPCVDLARGDWFGQLNVDISGDLLPARTKNPVATSKKKKTHENLMEQQMQQ